MHCYYCIMSTRRLPVVDLCVLNADSDVSALARAREAAAKSGPIDLLTVYHGERLVASLPMSAQTVKEAA